MYDSHTVVHIHTRSKDNDRWVGAEYHYLPSGVWVLKLRFGSTDITLFLDREQDAMTISRLIEQAISDSRVEAG